MSAHSNPSTQATIADLEYYLGLIRLHKSDLQAQGVEHISVFGSAARREMRSDSDIDLLVSFKPERTPDVYAFVALGDQLSRLLGRKSDVVEERSILPQLQRRIKKEAVRAF